MIAGTRRKRDRAGRGSRQKGRDRWTEGQTGTGRSGGTWKRRAEKKRQARRERNGHRDGGGREIKREKGKTENEKERLRERGKKRE